MNARANQKKSTEPGDAAGPDTVKGKPAERMRDPAVGGGRGSGAPAQSLKLPLFLSIASLVAFADQVVKAIVVRHLYLHDSIVVIPEFFSITRIHNNGIAFGLFQDRLPEVFTIITLMSMLAVLYFYLTISPRSTLLTVGCSLILGGALGNLIDRFRLGYVVDFINFGVWPAFNLADSAVSIGVFLLMVSFFRGEKGQVEDAPRTAEDRAH